MRIILSGLAGWLFIAFWINTSSFIGPVEDQEAGTMSSSIHVDSTYILFTSYDTPFLAHGESPDYPAVRLSRPMGGGLTGRFARARSAGSALAFNVRYVFMMGF